MKIYETQQVEKQNLQQLPRNSMTSTAVRNRQRLTQKTREAHKERSLFGGLRKTKCIEKGESERETQFGGMLLYMLSAWRIWDPHADAPEGKNKCRPSRLGNGYMPSCQDQWTRVRTCWPYSVCMLIAMSPYCRKTSQHKLYWINGVFSKKTKNKKQTTKFSSINSLSIHITYQKIEVAG